MTCNNNMSLYVYVHRYVPWSSYPPSPAAPQYLPSPAPSPPSYSQPAPPSPAYYQQGGDYYDKDVSDLRNDPPGKLYSQFAITAPFQNSKESPLLHQLREESEKNRNKYGPLLPSYSNQYQTIDA